MTPSNSRGLSFDSQHTARLLVRAVVFNIFDNSRLKNVSFSIIIYKGNNSFDKIKSKKKRKEREYKKKVFSKPTLFF